MRRRDLHGRHRRRADRVCPGADAGLRGGCATTVEAMAAGGGVWAAAVPPPCVSSADSCPTVACRASGVLASACSTTVATRDI